MNKDHPNGTNTPAFDEKDIFVRPNYMVIDLDIAIEPYFYVTKKEVAEHMKNIVEGVIPEDPERYLHENVYV